MFQRCLPPLITLMMEAVRSSEMSVNMYKFTECNIQEDNHLQLKKSEHLAG
jgi:hypothetical protein